MIYGSIPAGGLGTRLQPIGFSKELAPVRHRAVVEYLIERMVSAGIEKIFINTASDKTDLIQYLSTKSEYRNHLIYMVRERKGLQDGILIPSQFLREDDILAWGLPDTIWYPKNGFKQLLEFKPESNLTLGLFDTGKPESYDSVVIDQNNRILGVEVKVHNPKTNWTWGIGKVKISEVSKLNKISSKTKNNLFGKSLNEYVRTNLAYAIQLKNSSYIDIGTVSDYDKADAFVKDHA